MPRPESISSFNECMTPFSTLPSDVTDESRGDAARVDLTHANSTNLTEDGGGKNELEKRGRLTSNIWDHFTDAGPPQKANSKIFKHCSVLVNYRKESESDKINLNNFSLFWRVISSIKDSKRPDWYRRYKKASHTVRLPATSSTK